jgi:hypothetical protein
MLEPRAHSIGLQQSFSREAPAEVVRARLGFGVAPQHELHR